MNIDMYRVFFPAGFILGFWGAFVWILYTFNFIKYPGTLHPEIMMGGFLLSFVVGFLCTAVPRFTNSFASTKKEIIISILLVLALFVSQFISSIQCFRMCSLSIFIFLASFVGRRFLYRKKNPPASFLFIGVGIISGLIGSSVLFLNKFNFIPFNLFSLGRLFIVQGYVLSFVLGIGSRLIPSLLGFAPPPDQAQKGLTVKIYLLLSLFFIMSYIVESFLSAYIGMILRDFIIIFIAFASWKIFRLPKRKAIHAYGLWLSCWLLVLGHTGASLFLEYKIHFMHLFYIGGLSLMTILIATRVTLSHGGHDVRMEVKSKALFTIIALFLTAAVIRFIAGFWSDEYQSYLLYAAVMWLFGLITWGVFFIPKVLFINQNSFQKKK